MGSRSGSDSGGGGNDMQVSGMEAALSTEKGISTAADTRISNTSFSPDGGGMIIKLITLIIKVIYKQLLLVMEKVKLIQI